MYPLILVIIALLIVALYPVVRDFLRQRRATLPAYVEGLQLLLDGKIKEAMTKLKLAVEEDTSNVDAYIRLGDIFLKQGDIERALRIHENLTLRRNLKPYEEKRVYQALVRDYIKAGRPVKAIPLLEELTRSDPNDIENRELLLELSIDAGSWEKCETLLKDLGRHPPARFSRLLAVFGYAYGKVNPKQGQHWLEEALRINPNSVIAPVLLGDLLLQQGEIEGAIKIWQNLLEKYPDKNYLIRSRLERAYYELGRYEDVAQLYRRLLQKVPQDSGLAVALAKIYAKKENWEEAINLLKPFEKDGDINAVVVLAGLLLKMEQPARAQKLLEDATAKLEKKARNCRNCAKPINESEIRCPECRAWQEE